MSQKKKSLIRKVQSDLTASRKLSLRRYFISCASHCISRRSHVCAYTTDGAYERRIRRSKEKVPGRYPVNERGPNNRDSLCEAPGVVSSSRLTGKRRFRRRYKTHATSARFLRPGSAAFYIRSTFRSDEKPDCDVLKP